MKESSVVVALSSTLLFSSALARYGLDPDSIPLLTRTVDYTFHSICDDFHNPVPTPLFDELGLAKTIFGITNDPYSFLMGYSIGGNNENNNDTDNDKQRVVISDHPSLRARLRETQHGSNLLHGLIDEMMQNTRRSGLLESQTVIAKNPVGDKIMEQEATMHRYSAKEKFDCPKFQHDVYEFAESFKNMTYAISEKCYRQCTPTTTYGSAAYAVYRLQTAYERHYSGSFYTQIREIEAETGCYFDDTFMVDTERAVDYAKVWIGTFQRGERPCAGLGDR